MHNVGNEQLRHLTDIIPGLVFCLDNMWLYEQEICLTKTQGFILLNRCEMLLDKPHCIEYHCALQIPP